MSALPIDQEIDRRIADVSSATPDIAPKVGLLPGSRSLARNWPIQVGAIVLGMLVRPLLADAALVSTLGFALAASAQTVDLPKTAVAHVFHPTAPLPSYEVATIKPFEPTPVAGGMRQIANTTIRNYIRGAYAASGILPSTQVVGGPGWLDKDTYIIQAKPPGDLELAMQKMKNDDRLQLDHAMRQSLLADRFHLKVHFEVREMPVYALVPAKGGLKIKPVADPAPPDPDATSSRAAGKPPPNSGSTQMMMGAGGIRILRAHAISMAQFASIIGAFIDQTSSNFISMNTANRPVLDQTGFTGYFDLDGLKWASPDSADSTNAPDAPALTTALEESLGIKIVSTKGPVELVVIESIDHPSEN